MNFENLPRFAGFQIQIICEIPKWEQIFEVDREAIERQIGFAHGWADNNPKKAPKKNVMRYLYNWMLIAKRKGTLVKRIEAPKPRAPEPEPDMTIEEMRTIREQNFRKFA